MKTSFARGKAMFAILNPAECDKTLCLCDLCGALPEFQFVCLSDILGRECDDDEVNICHDCLEKMQTALNHELRSK